MTSNFVEIVPLSHRQGNRIPLQPSDGMILVIGPRLEGHSVTFLAIQIHLSCRFLLAVNSLGLRRSGSSSQIINQAQDFLEQAPRHRYLGQLERDVPAMADNFGPDLDQLLAQSGQRPVLGIPGQREFPLVAESGPITTGRSTSAIASKSNLTGISLGQHQTEG